MRTVVLLGTSHPLQCGTQETLPPDALERLLRSLCAAHGVQVIAEEIEHDGLAKYGVTETIGARVCKALGIQSVYCDASIAERASLRELLPPLPPIEPTLPFDQRLRLEIDAQFKQMGDAREDFWLDKILHLNMWPLLFICGADHFDTFRSKLVKNGIYVVDSVADWEP
ncbi:hypothetical protein ACXZ1M_24435 [Duganella sp. PWIR1]